MRRKKLTEEQRNEIREAFIKDHAPYSVLADKYNVSKNTILRICNPEKYEKQLEANKEYRKKNKDKINENIKNNYSKYTFIFHNVNDKDILKKINEQDNVSEYLKNLIKKDIEETNK